ncbi:MAG: ABC transporter transmembrane domain-containing protein, partial [Gammaproteobacteria bacterium]|nr:ABC transporter transmembrane domain-containing protein [Gammaproteobacteria bacterium]
MSKRIDPQVRDVYGRLWHYVTPHKLIGFIAVVGMTATAIVEAGLVYLLQPLMDDTLVAKQVESGRWIPLAFMGIFLLRGLSGFATEASLGWIGRSVISDLRRQVFNKFLTLPVRFFDGQAAGPLLSKLTYNVEMVAESVTSV